MPTPVHRIAIAIPKYGLTGGAEGFTAEITNRIAANPLYEIHVFANRWSGRAAGVRFHRVPIISFPKFLTTISFAWFARRMISRLDFELVHAHDRLLAADVFTMHGIPHRLWVREIRGKHLSLYDLVTDLVEKKLVNNDRCRYFLAVSGLAREKFLQAYNQIDPHRVKVVSPGVDAARFEKLDRQLCRREIRDSFGIGAAETVILFVSMNFEVKGLDRLITALAALRADHPDGGFKLLVVGKGNRKKHLALARKMDLERQLVFTGVLGQSELDKVYLASDVFSLLSRFDTFGMVVLEAMAASLPVVISENVGARDLVREGGNGFIINDGESAGMIAAKFGRLLDCGLRAQMGAAALRTAHDHTWEQVVEKITAIYDSLRQSFVSSKMPQP